MEGNGKVVREADRFRVLLDMVSIAIVVVDRRGKIVLVNKQTEQLFGYEREELLGREIELLVPQRVREMHRQQREQYFVNPKIRLMGQGLDLYGLRKNGTEFPIEIGLSPFQTEDETLVSSAISDITERKKVESERNFLSVLT